jgi:tRNA (Thr-GGU) A37 N-methylase
MSAMKYALLIHESQEYFEAIDGTPVIDVKPAVEQSDNF